MKDDLDISDSELFSDDDIPKTPKHPKVPALKLNSQQPGSTPKDSFFDKDALCSDDDDATTRNSSKYKNGFHGNAKQSEKNGFHSKTQYDDLEIDLDGLDDTPTGKTPQNKSKKSRTPEKYQKFDSKTLDLSSAEYQNMMKEITSSVNDFKQHKTQHPFSYEQQKQLKDIQDSVNEYTTKLKKEKGPNAELDYRMSEEYKMKMAQLERDTEANYASINKLREPSKPTSQPDTVDKLYRVFMENQALEEQRKRLDKRLDVQDNKPQEESIADRLKRIAEDNQRLMSENQQLDRQLKSPEKKKANPPPPQFYSSESKFELPSAVQELISKRYERPPPTPPLSPIKPNISNINMSIEEDDSSELFPVQHQKSPERAKRVADLQGRISKLALENEKMQKYHVSASAPSGISTPRSDQSRISKVTDSSGLEYYSKKLALLQSFQQDDITTRPSSSISVQSKRTNVNTSVDSDKDQFKKQALKQRLADATNLLTDLIDTSIHQKQRLQKNLKIVDSTIHSANNPPKPRNFSAPRSSPHGWEQSPYGSTVVRRKKATKKKKEKEPPKTDFIKKNKELSSTGLLSYGTRLNVRSAPSTPEKPRPPPDKDFVQKNITEVKKRSDTLSAQNWSASIEQAMKLFEKSKKAPPRSPQKKERPTPPLLQIPQRQAQPQQVQTPKPLPVPPPRRETPRRQEIEEEDVIEDEPIEDEPLEEEEPIEEEAIEDDSGEIVEEEEEEVQDSYSIEDDYEADEIEADIPDDYDLEDELFD